MYKTSQVYTYILLISLVKKSCQTQTEFFKKKKKNPIIGGGGGLKDLRRAPVWHNIS